MNHKLESRLWGEISTTSDITTLRAGSEGERKSLLMRVKIYSVEYSFPNLEPVCCPMSCSNHCFLTYIQVSQETGKWPGIPISLRIIYSLLRSTQKLQHSQWGRSRGFSGILLLFYDPMDVGNLISGSSAFSKFSLCIWKFLVHLLLKPNLEDFEHDLAIMWNEWTVW